MRFEVTQRFDAPIDEVLDRYSSTELFESLPEFGKIRLDDVLDRTSSGNTVTMRLRYRFTAELPAAATAVVDPRKLTWVEETTYDLAAATASVRLIPDHYDNKMQATATTTFTERGGATNRVIRGDLRVRVFLVAGQVERAIVSGLTEHLDEEAIHVNALIAQG